MLCAISYHFNNWKSVKNTHGGVLLLVKLPASACNFSKSNTPLWVFFTFFKFYKWYQIAQSISNIVSQNCSFYSIKTEVFTVWSVSKYGVFSGANFLTFALNTRKYGPEKTPYLNTFHAVLAFQVNYFMKIFSDM